MLDEQQVRDSVLKPDVFERCRRRFLAVHFPKVAVRDSVPVRNQEEVLIVEECFEEVTVAFYQVLVDLVFTTGLVHDHPLGLADQGLPPS